MKLEGGLVLEGGGMRGFYTAGVLDYFMKKDINFNECYAVSAGVTQGLNFLSHQRKRGMKLVLRYLSTKQYASPMAKILTGDFYEKKFHTDTVPNKLLPYDYEYALNNPMDFYAVATDCVTGEPVYKRVNDLRNNMDWVWASGALPVFTRVVEIDGGFYLDGGMSDSIPVKKSAEHNKKNVLILTRDETYKKESSTATNSLMKVMYGKKYPGLCEDIKNRADDYNATLEYIREHELAGDLFVIRPKKPVTIGRLEKDREAIRELYKDGYLDAKECFEDMLEFFED